MSKKIFLLTFPNGTTAYRTSASKIYTHAVVEAGTFRVLAWAGSFFLASKAQGTRYCKNHATFIAEAKVVDSIPKDSASTGGNGTQASEARKAAQVAHDAQMARLGCDLLSPCVIGRSCRNHAEARAAAVLEAGIPMPAHSYEEKKTTKTFTVSMTRVSDLEVEIEASTPAEAEQIARDMVAGNTAAWEASSEISVLVDGEEVAS